MCEEEEEEEEQESDCIAKQNFLKKNDGYPGHLPSSGSMHHIHTVHNSAMLDPSLPMHCPVLLTHARTFAPHNVLYVYFIQTHTHHKHTHTYVHTHTREEMNITLLV